MRSNYELLISVIFSHSHASERCHCSKKHTNYTAGGAMYFILVTLSLLTSLLLHPGLGEPPKECSADSSGEINH